MFCYCVSSSDVYYWCLSAIDCTGKDLSDGLLNALGEADANMYLCSKDLRPSEREILTFHHMLLVKNLKLYTHLIITCQSLLSSKLVLNRGDFCVAQPMLQQFLDFVCSSEWWYWMGLHFGAWRQQLQRVQQHICAIVHDCTVVCRILPVNKHISFYRNATYFVHTLLNVIFMYCLCNWTLTDWYRVFYCCVSESKVKCTSAFTAEWRTNAMQLHLQSTPNTF